MFGIGLPEMIVIFAVALIVVGPDKLPELAKSLAKGILELKKTVNQLKDNLAEEEDTLNEVQKDLRKTADELKERMLDTETKTWGPDQSLPAGKDGKEEELIELSPEPARPWEEDAARAPGTPDEEQPAEIIDEGENQASPPADKELNDDTAK